MQSFLKGKQFFAFGTVSFQLHGRKPDGLVTDNQPPELSLPPTPCHSLDVGNQHISEYFYPAEGVIPPRQTGRSSASYGKDSLHPREIVFSSRNISRTGDRASAERCGSSYGKESLHKHGKYYFLLETSLRQLLGHLRNSVVSTTGSMQTP